jgi:hypothetical protein
MLVAADPAEDQNLVGKVLAWKHRERGEHLSTMCTRAGISLRMGGFFTQYLDDYLHPDN